MRTHRAFTLIELLMVILVIMILMGLTLQGISVLRRQAKVASTRARIEIAMQGMELFRAANGGVPAPAEHPLAASAEPRPAFIRSGGGAVAAMGEALRNVQLSDLATGQDRLLLDDDRHADISSPLLYGAPRRWLGVIGAPLSTVTRYRQLVRPPSWPAGSFIDPTGGQLVAPAPSVGTGAEASRAFDYVVGSQAIAELARLRAVFEPPSDNPTVLIAGGRVWSAAAAGIPVPTGCPVLSDAGTWKPYRLRGKALYDAWNREIVFSLAANGGIQLISAGPDGALRVDPGTDRAFTTAANASQPAAGDRDGSRDNIASGPIQ